MSKLLREQEFYALLYQALRKDMKEKGIRVLDLRNPKFDYIVKSSSLWDIKRIAKGETIKGLSKSKLEEICSALGIEFELMFKTEENKE